MNRNFLLALLVLVLALAACSEPTPPYPTADLVISPTGKLTLDGRSIAEKDLVQELKAVHERDPEMIVFVRRDSSQSDQPPVTSMVFKAAEEAGVGITVTSYKEQEVARWWKSRLGDLAFFGSMVLVAILASTPFALKAETSSLARRREFSGVMIKSMIIASLVGLFLDIRDMNSPGSWNVRFVVMPIVTLPYAIAGGLLASWLCAWRVGIRSRTTKIEA